MINLYYNLIIYLYLFLFLFYVKKYIKIISNYITLSFIILIFNFDFNFKYINILLDSINRYQKMFDEYSYVTKRLIEPLVDTYEIAEKEKSDIAAFCRFLKNYHQECLNELEALNREINFESNDK